MSLGCMVCDDKAACAVIDELLEKSFTYAYVARVMTLRGFSITAPTIGRHDKHRGATALPEVVKRKRDFAIMVRDKAADLLEDDKLDLTNKDTVPGINAGLKAQAALDKREANRPKQGLADVLLALLGALKGEPPKQLTEGEVIEGSAVEVE